MKLSAIAPLLSSLVLLVAPMHAVSAEPIRVGAVLSTTGPGAFGGGPQLKALELYVKQLNAQGGVLGRELKLISYDDATDAAKANALTKRLIESDRVDFIIGATTSGSTLSMMPLVEKAGIPLVSMGGAMSIIEPVKKWTFKLAPTDRQVVERVFDDLRARGLTKVAMLCDTSGYGQGGRKEAHDMAKSKGIEIVADESFGTKDADVTPQLTRIKTNPAAQAVLIFAVGQGMVTATKNFRQIGLSVPLYHTTAAASSEFLSLVGPAGEGIRFPTPAIFLVDDLPNDAKQKPLLMSFKAAYEQAYKEEPPSFASFAYDSLMLVVNAIKSAQSTDKEKVRSAMERTTGWVAAIGVVNMSQSDHMGFEAKDLWMAEIRNGRQQMAK